MTDLARSGLLPSGNRLDIRKIKTLGGPLLSEDVAQARSHSATAHAAARSGSREPSRQLRVRAPCKCDNFVCRIRYNPYSARPPLYPSPGGKVVPNSLTGETHTGEMLQASILTNLVYTVLSLMITVSWFACRGQSVSPFPSPTLVYAGLHLCLA
jgi:hypothetical protein